MFTIFYGDCKVFRIAIFTRIVKIRNEDVYGDCKAFVVFRFLQKKLFIACISRRPLQSLTDLAQNTKASATRTSPN